MNTGKKTIVNRTKPTKFSHSPERTQHSEEDTTKTAGLTDAKSIIKAELQKTSNKEEEIQLNRELARTLLKQAEIARGEGKNKNEIKMIQDLAKICQKQAEMEQRRKIRENNKMRGNRKCFFGNNCEQRNKCSYLHPNPKARRKKCFFGHGCKQKNRCSYSHPKSCLKTPSCGGDDDGLDWNCLLYTSPSPRDS